MSNAIWEVFDQLLNLTSEYKYVALCHSGENCLENYASIFINFKTNVCLFTELFLLFSADFRPEFDLTSLYLLIYVTDNR